MSFPLLRTSAFVRAAGKYTRKNPKAAVDLESALVQLAEDPFQPALRSHQLKGKLKGSWACSAGYDLRIIFSFVKRGQSDAILLESIGTHDEVY